LPLGEGSIRRLLRSLAAMAVTLTLAPTPAVATDDPLLESRWKSEVEAGRRVAAYPRPQMVRKDWLSLDGLWEYAIIPDPGEGKAPNRAVAWQGKIRVPFPVESDLSGVGLSLPEGSCLVYRRHFEIPKSWTESQVLLHFGAVDHEATVFVDGKLLGHHRGGYDPFTVELPLPGPLTSREREVVVLVRDPTDGGTQPRGKQVRRPGGIWYTPASGIWQTVWLEPVPETRIDSLRMIPLPDIGILELEVRTKGLRSQDLHVRARASASGRTVAVAQGKAGAPLRVEIPNPHLWSPDDPFLHDLEVDLVHGGSVVDSVGSYFGLRSVSLGQHDGRKRILLNGEPLFMIGTLDQGYWPDGLYTAPTDEALLHDLEVTRRLGFNTVRKHVKVEPDRWYYHCDRLGLLVWQDMPSGDRSISPRDPDLERTEESSLQFRGELTFMVEHLFNHPSVVVWVPFNEGWGQFDTPGITRHLRELDPTRLVISASGWTDRGTGDLVDIHRYPGPGAPEPETERASVLGEFGGLGLPVEGHLFREKGSWGYRGVEDGDELTASYERLLSRVHRLVGTHGLSGAIYTQITDVEIEVNGLMTYDRKVIKVDAERVAAANRRLRSPPPRLVTVVPVTGGNAIPWRWTTDEPPAGWTSPGFDDSSWRLAPGGFGTEETPGARIGTTWTTGEIWLRRTFVLEKEPPATLGLLVHHDEDAEVYLNGVLATLLTGYTTDYVDEPIRPEALAALRPGENLLAVHCRQTSGGQFIDVGLVVVVDSERDGK